MKKIFTEDDAYAEGEYEKTEEQTIDTTYVSADKSKIERENWSGRFDVSIFETSVTFFFEKKSKMIFLLIFLLKFFKIN